MSNKTVATRTETSPAAPEQADAEHRITPQDDDLLALTREEFMTLVNGAADLILDALDLGERDSDLINLVVNATGAMIDNPDVTFDEMVIEQYSETPDELRGWWDWS
ncbi:hypothetical protein ACFWA9_09970 [Kitasatospora sp. NPDC059973]|uniref:hypothetical protein n=1 Tax=Kitasatospora sp. NPDC059973 TaxID=3347020 RepID=UPI0036BCB62A